MKLAISHLLASMNPNNEEVDPEIASCCICLSDMEPYQALFLAPCSHCFHYKCCTPLLACGFMFQCPLCRQVANLEADVIQDIDSEPEEKDTVTDLSPIEIPQEPAIVSSLPNLRTPPNRSSFPDSLNLTNLSSLSLEPGEMESSRAQQILFEYETTMNQLSILFPGLADDDWRERLASVQQGISDME